MKLPRCLINPQTFVITRRQIAELLKIDPDRIIRWEKWEHVLWVHIKGRGGYFVSYRKLQQWVSACGVLLHSCCTLPELTKLWEAIQKEAKRYTTDGIGQLEEIWYEQKTRLSNP
jgi:hypothetical protein